jgi:hypothetical protein
MRKLTGLVLVLLGLLAMVGWRAAPAGLHEHAKATATVINNSSVHGSYAFSESIHDPITGQEGNAAGTIVFDGNGGITGVYSQNSRCNATCGGQQQVTRALVTGTYVVYPDGSATLTVCIQLTSPFQPTQAIWEGAFSTSFFRFRYIQTTIATPCTAAPVQTPNVTSGTADKL